MSDRPIRDRTTGLVMCGGASRRMQALGPVDKALLDLHGQPLVAHAIGRLRPQVGALLLGANGRLDDYRAFGLPIVQDAGDGRVREGPVAGIVAALEAIAGDHRPAPDDRWLVTVPCDSPLFPPDLVERLALAARGANADVAIARTGQQRHPVFALIHVRTRPRLAAAFAAGERRLIAALSTAGGGVAEALFDDEASFANLNTPDELAQARRHPLAGARA